MGSSTCLTELAGEEPDLAANQINHWRIGGEQPPLLPWLYAVHRTAPIRCHADAWQDISHKTGRIKVRQQKTGMKFKIPGCTSGLESCAGKCAAQLRHHHQPPNTANRSQGVETACHPSCAMPSEPQDFRSIVSAGLRKAAGRRLAEAGCSTKQIMAILGHKSLGKRNDTRRKPIESGWRRTRCCCSKRKTRTKSAQTAHTSLGNCRKNPETQSDHGPAGAP